MDKLKLLIVMYTIILNDDFNMKANDNERKYTLSNIVSITRLKLIFFPSELPLCKQHKHPPVFILIQIPGYVKFFNLIAPFWKLDDPSRAALAAAAAAV